MNKKNKNTTDHSAPYRSLGLDKIEAPVKPKSVPKSRVIKSSDDLRTRGGKA